MITEGGGRVHRADPGPHRRAGQGRRRRHVPDLQHRRQRLLPQRRPPTRYSASGPLGPVPPDPTGAVEAEKAILAARHDGHDDPARRAVDGAAARRSGTRQTFETWKLANVARRTGALPARRRHRRRSSAPSRATSRCSSSSSTSPRPATSDPGTSSGCQHRRRRAGAALRRRLAARCRSSSPSALGDRVVLEPPVRRIVQPTTAR